MGRNNFLRNLSVKGGEREGCSWRRKLCQRRFYFKDTRLSLTFSGESQEERSDSRNEVPEKERRIRVRDRVERDVLRLIPCLNA